MRDWLTTNEKRALRSMGTRMRGSTLEGLRRVAPELAEFIEDYAMPVLVYSEGLFKINPYIPPYVKTICDQCGIEVQIRNTFLLCPDCRRRYCSVITELSRPYPWERFFWRKLWDRVRRDLGK